MPVFGNLCYFWQPIWIVNPPLQPRHSPPSLRFQRQGSIEVSPKRTFQTLPVELGCASVVHVSACTSVSVQTRETCDFQLNLSAELLLLVNGICLIGWS